jgi:2'-5' RNA ligase
METSSEIIRAFIAFPIPSETRNLIAQTCENLLVNPKGLKIVKPENYHLTLAFIGDIPLDHVSTIHDDMTQYASEVKPFKVSFDRIGTFPSVIFVRPSTGERDLTDLTSGVRTILRKKEVPYDDKPFKGHMTIARVRDRKNAKEFIHVHAFDSRFNIEFESDRIFLIKSDLQPEGPIYTTLKEYQFKNQ